MSDKFRKLNRTWRGLAKKCQMRRLTLFVIKSGVELINMFRHVPAGRCNKANARSLLSRQPKNERVNGRRRIFHQKTAATNCQYSLHEPYDYLWLNIILHPHARADRIAITEDVVHAADVRPEFVFVQILRRKRRRFTR